MSQIKRLLDNKDFVDLLKNLISKNYLSHKAEIGITRKVINDGVESLTPNQWKVFEDYIKPYLKKICSRCSSEISYGDILEALDNGGYCSYCYHQIQNEKDA